MSSDNGDPMISNEQMLENLKINSDNGEYQNSEEQTVDASGDNAQNDESDDDSRKLFVGGLSWETTENDLKEYFTQWGKVSQGIIKVDRVTGCSRGFGFVTMESEDCVTKVLAVSDHKLRGKKIDPKKAKPSREPPKKIFVGGLDPDLTEDQIKEYFSQYGKIETMDLPFDTQKGKRKNYIFVCFSTGVAAKKAIVKERQEICGKLCDVRLAVTREQANRQKVLKQFCNAYLDPAYSYTNNVYDYLNPYAVDPYAYYYGYDFYGNPNPAPTGAQNPYAAANLFRGTTATGVGPTPQMKPQLGHPGGHHPAHNSVPVLAHFGRQQHAAGTNGGLNLSNRLGNTNPNTASGMHHHTNSMHPNHQHHVSGPNNVAPNNPHGAASGPQGQPNASMVNSSAHQTSTVPGAGGAAVLDHDYNALWQHPQLQTGQYNRA